MAPWAPARDSGGVSGSESAGKRPPGRAHIEAHGEGGGTQSAEISTRLNWLRAGVLGANDGIISTAGLVVGMAGATTSRPAILAAGVAGLLAGSLSMAAGEYVSVSSQRDSERAALDMERRELAEEPEAELDELTDLLAERDSAGRWRGRPPSS